MKNFNPRPKIGGFLFVFDIERFWSNCMDTQDMVSYVSLVLLGNQKIGS